MFNEMSLKKVKELLGVTDIPGTPEDLKEILEFTQNLVENRGEYWIRQNKHISRNGVTS